MNSSLSLCLPRPIAILFWLGVALPAYFGVGSGDSGGGIALAAAPPKLQINKNNADTPQPERVMVFPTIETAAKFALLVDYSTGAVMLDKGGNDRLYPSSMTKMMTAYLVLDRLQKGSLKLSDSFMVSDNAWRKGGAMTDSSTMFLPPNRPATVEDLIQGVIVQSGNDASIALAEGLSGSESAFVGEMNAKAAEFGMKDSHFTNSTGIPDKQHYSTARDLAILSWHTIHDHPEYYHYYGQRRFAYNRHDQENRNRLLFEGGTGVDGLKTGHTEISGYGIAVTSLRNGRRLVLVVNGLPSMQLRASESKKLLNWGYAQFDNYTIAAAGDQLALADVWQGQKNTVGLVAKSAVVVTLPRQSRDYVKLTVNYNGPLIAPIAAGAEVASLTVSAPGVDDSVFPLLVAESVPQLGWFKRMGWQLSEVFTRMINRAWPAQ
ncbi:MAG: D-alanyl-D-alanine carboxypeptidase family protein [Candidatus Pacebacteria bacterium]|nr:D-alanyl-D-alanine carboxypeptidase family protein [Candidatus Paceibacterota bacterium]